MSKRLKSNTIRIIAGNWRGRRLHVLASEGLRPTTDRVRETLFNWLIGEVQAARCLDLFAGSGVLGLECLSRGAAFVQFVDVDQKVVARLRDNLHDLKVTPLEVELTRMDALDFVVRQATAKFDLVFLDPPFKADLLGDVAMRLEQNNWLAADALVYVEQAAKQDSARVPENWQKIKHGKAGQSAYCLYRRQAVFAVY